ncbi:S-layer homology domain-containing protein [Alkalihalophilus marmarensis]|uniref:SLH domain-containing protein n=1 Tax=Alkalihalophilus marmarensis DSM 21297 TaxID=1188261 RepID=U6SJW1_9BACI|nr:S-layer homology domain-containing protein [Alkalihalophilus marmarensis]ERN52009.1 hypothetical protein A33I_18120 [Alkalihalophilus marmarensis DSM 21297]
MKQKTLPVLLATSLLASTLFVPTTFAANSLDITNNENSEAELTVEQSGFKDVPATHYAYDSIHYLHGLGYVSGKGNNLFAPNDQITRAEAAVMIANVTGYSASSSYTLKATDIPLSHYAYEALRALEQRQIMQGYDKKMRPNDLITRAEVSVLLSKSFNYAEPTRFHHFTDVNRDAWSYEYINKLAENGITSQQGANFMPIKQTTRAEFATFVARSLNDRFK